jgi:uncharacterized protein YebE (UPF0316 family)
LLREYDHDVRKDLRKMGVNNWIQRTQERKKWKEIIEQSQNSQRVVDLIKKKKKKRIRSLLHYSSFLSRVPTSSTGKETNWKIWA